MVRCSIIEYRRGDYVLYPLGRDEEKIKHLHGKEVYTNRSRRVDIKQYKPI
ncbi:MAG: hypothetical protein QXE66_03885 [Desulfurococcaceae archaeon]